MCTDWSNFVSSFNPHYLSVSRSCIQVGEYYYLVVSMWLCASISLRQAQIIWSHERRDLIVKVLLPLATTPDLLCSIFSPCLSGTDELKLEVARTCNILAVNPVTTDDQANTESSLVGSSSTTTTCNEAPILVGYLWKKSQSASRADEASNVWYRRWFVLKRDNCLYYFKNQDVSRLHYTPRRMWVTTQVDFYSLCHEGRVMVIQ